MKRTGTGTARETTPGIVEKRSGRRIYYVGTYFWMERTRTTYKLRCLVKDFGNLDDAGKVDVEYLQFKELVARLRLKDKTWNDPGEKSSKSPWKKAERVLSSTSALLPEHSTLKSATKVKSASPEAYLRKVSRKRSPT